MSILKKTIIVFLILGVLGIAFLWRYASMHSMDEVRPFTVNDVGLQHHVLIATQGSAFKDSVVVDVISQLKAFPVHIKVIDVNQLSEINENEWSVIVILHTWEMFGPQEEAKKFVEQVTNTDKVIVISTSGSGEEALVALDGISSASLMIEVPSIADRIVMRVKTLLQLP